MSDRTKIGIVVAVLIALIPLWNFLAEGAAAAFHPKKKIEPTHQEDKPLIQLPIIKGPKGAPVEITAYLSGNNPCHMTSITMLEQLAEEYPDQVRIEIYDKDKPDVAKEAERVKIGCEMGILINGRGAFNLPGRGIVMLQGPVDASHDYSLEDLRLIVERIIRSKTGKPPKRKPAKSVHGDKGSCLHGAPHGVKPPEEAVSRNEAKPAYGVTVGGGVEGPPGHQGP